MVRAASRTQKKNQNYINSEGLKRERERERERESVCKMVSSNSAVHQLAPNFTRDEARLTVQWHLTRMHRRCFLHEEFEMILKRMELSGCAGKRPPTSGIDYDRHKVRDNINTKLRLIRSLIRRNAHYIDGVLYQSAGTLEEYQNMNDIEERTYQVIQNSSTPQVLDWH